MQAESLLETHFLYIQIQLHRLDFLGDSDFLHRVVVQGVAQEPAQAGDHTVGLARLS